MSKEGPAIGIDLGTTFSCAAVVKDDQIKVLPGDDGLPIMASCVYFKKTGDRLIGNLAKKDSGKNPSNALFGVKRFIGRTFDEFQAQESNIIYPYKVENKNGKPVIKINHKNGEKEFVPEEVSAMILAKLKEQAEESLNTKITKAVITVPAHFNIAQRQATKYAGQIAGLEVLRIINEPTAAALSYELDSKYKDKKSIILVYDFGGGTFDVSVVTLLNGIVEVIATDGDSYLGGDDMDLRLANYIVEEFKKNCGVDIKKEKQDGQKLAQLAFTRILRKAEQIKVRLSKLEFVDIDLASLYQGEDFECTVSRRQFEEMCMEQFEKSMDCVKKTLEDAKLEKTDIDEIVLVGGTTRIPYVREMLRKYFDKEINASLQPDEAVAIGAARQAAIIACPDYSKVKSFTLFDVCSLSLGIEMQGEYIKVIIPRNTKIPVKKTSIHRTVIDNQMNMRLDIYEGERTMSTDNRKLSNFQINGVTPAEKGKTSVLVTFSLDQDGILHVLAEEQGGSAISNISVDMNNYQLSVFLIKQMVEKANILKEYDEELKSLALAKIKLKDYCVDIKKKLYKQNNLNDGQKKDVSKKIENALIWLNSKVYWSSNDVIKKNEEVKNFCDSFFS